jgi:GNAT superfamily N-acetyltransferase
MQLTRAKIENGWKLAEQILLQVIDHLDENGKSLWHKSQVAESALKKLYQLDELYFLRSESEAYGMAFIQCQDSVVWPEIQEEDAYYLHKLAVLPKYRGCSYGYKIIDAALNLARLHGLRYLRLDCDPRPELMAFYEAYGFVFVSVISTEQCQVVKYEIPTRFNG